MVQRPNQGPRGPARMMALAVTTLIALLAGCGTDPPAPAFRTGPPSIPVVVSLGASARVSVLSGWVYAATSDALDAATGLPQGYAPLADGDAKILVHQVGTKLAWQQAIASGSYAIQGLPVGVPLEVTATKTGLQPRTQDITLPPSGVGKLSFEYQGHQDDSYLLPQPSYLNMLPH